MNRRNWSGVLDFMLTTCYKEDNRPCQTGVSNISVSDQNSKKRGNVEANDYTIKWLLAILICQKVKEFAFKPMRLIVSNNNQTQITW